MIQNKEIDIDTINEKIQKAIEFELNELSAQADI